MSSGRPSAMTCPCASTTIQSLIAPVLSTSLYFVVFGAAIGGRIQEVEGKLSAAQIIDPATLDAGGKIVFGTTVDLEDEDSGEAVTYQIVGEDEADLKLGRVNISSPIARALIGKEEGDTAEVQAPGGTKRYEIVAVSYV